ncbi:hypothetical protein HFN20_13960 [Paenibacillus dendritiformis]|uniref:hypothetical protein n=1 Tax=Paenibacillus dendritiformis TaxID=130049 RepID=UPI00143CD33D|nr:hypothetical protein [Paenibacillus dendritiformis]NKI22309.1 hypothetical protein [Paenibacillus dendritiformis]NRF99525.1 hypothetical protein [Paenibacillus dendritiformis]
MAHISEVTAIPEITSNTPELIYEYISSPYRAFDRTEAPCTFSYASSTGYIGYSFNEPIVIGKYTIKGGKEHYPTAWNFQGSNDLINWETLHSVSNQNFFNGLKKEFELNNQNKYKYYRVYFTAKTPTNYSSDIHEIEMMAIVYDNKVLVNHNGTYKYYNSSWVTIGTNVYDSDFLNYGMDDPSIIPESKWAELKGEIELCYYTDDPNKTEAFFNIETEPFTLAEEFDAQTIKIIEYTENPDQEDSTITLETEPFTFYDEVGDSFDVLYYTDDPDKTEAELEVSHNYSPLDELDGDFELVTWTMEEEAEVQEELKRIFKEKIEDGDLYGVTVDLSKGTINIK